MAMQPTDDGAATGADWFASQGQPTSHTMTTPATPPAAPGGAPASAPAPSQQQIMALFPNGVTPEALKAALPQLNQWGIHVQNEQRGDVRPRLLMPNGETVDLGAWNGPAQWQQRGNIGDWHAAYNAGATGTGAGGSTGGKIGEGLETSPGFQFRLGEGVKALERSAAAKGTLLTGGTLKGLTRYTQDYASNEYNNRYNQLYGLSQLGLNAAGQSANVGSSYAANTGNLLSNQANTGTGLITGGANAGAAGTVGAGNAWQQAFGSTANAAQQAYLLWLMNQGGAGANPAAYVNRDVGSVAGRVAAPAGWNG